MNDETHRIPAPASHASLPTYLAMMGAARKHSTSATSTLDVLWVLYDRVLSVDPTDPSNPERDRFLLSKGHGPMAYYAILAAKGFIPVHQLETFGQYDSPLGHHPDRALIPGVEIASGSLGHGLPIAVGVALALTARASGARVFVLVGDAELDEGSNHEAIALAGRLGLERLCTVVVDNRSSTHGWPGGIASRFETEGWTTTGVDGRDHAALTGAFTLAPDGRPHAVVARVGDKA